MKREPYAWRVYYEPPGSGIGYCGEFDNKQRAVEHAESSPDCTWDYMWESHRKAMGGASLWAPSLDGVEGVMDTSWHGLDGWHCVVPVYREERE